MRLVIVTSLVLLGLTFGDGLSFSAAAQTSISRLLTRVAETSEACLTNCSQQNASCKRACPTTFSTPCNLNCDSQEQTCRRSCQTK